MYDFPLGNDTYTILRAPLVVDARDNTSYRDWDNAVEIVVTGAKVNPFQLAEKLNFEINSEREYARTGMKFFGPPNEDELPESTDRILFRDQEWSVFGVPLMWTDFEGELDHIEFVAQLKVG